MNMTPRTADETLIADFLNTTLRGFYTTLDGTPCVTVKGPAGRLEDVTVANMVKRIERFKAWAA